MREGARTRRWIGGSRREKESKSKEGRGGGVIGSESQRRTWLEGTAEEMRGAESTFVSLFSPSPVLLVNFISLILSL